MPNKRVYPHDHYQLEQANLSVNRIKMESEEFVLRPVGELVKHVFEVCPICLSEAPKHDEHVPPGSMGGKVLTVTCQACNNNFGRLVEDEMIAWVFDELKQARFENPDSQMRGRRAFGDVYLRADDEGHPIFWIVPRIGYKGDSGDAMLSPPSSNVTIQFRAADAKKYRVAALKQAYLAACILTKEIPTGSLADQIRSELLAVRDWNGKDEFPGSSIADDLDIGRAHISDVKGAPAAILALPHTEGDPPSFVFAGRVSVSWPLGAGEWNIHFTDSVARLEVEKVG